MAKSIFPLVFLFLFPAYIFAGIRNKPRNIIYVEVMGKGGYGSLNYERLIFGNKLLGAGLGAGIGTYNIFDYEGNFNPDLIIPLSGSVYFFSPHRIEVGAGNTFSSIVHTGHPGPGTERVNSMSAGLFFGYRYQRQVNGIIIRAGYSPVIEFYSRIVHRAGVSFGYAF